MRGEPLDPGDITRLWMGTAENPMVVTALLALDGPIPEGELRELVRSRILTHPRFRQRIVVPRLPVGRPRWCDDDRGLDAHVLRVALDPQRSTGPGDSELALRALVSRLASAPLVPTESTWRVWHVDGVGEGAALVVRVHHALADGLALVGVLLGLSDEGVGLLPPMPPHAPAGPHGAANLVMAARALGGLMRRGADAPRALRARPSGVKHLAWSKPMPLAAFKATAHAANAHVNDLVLGVLAGALREWLRRRGAPSPGPVRALVPVALPHDAGALGNRFASVFADLPVHIEDSMARIDAARAGMVAARASSRVSLGHALVDLAPALGRHGERLGVRLMSRRASLVASNVAGPTAALHVAGRSITSVIFAAPCPGSIGLSVNTMSYAGALRLTVASDAGLTEDPGEIVAAFEAELARIDARLRERPPGGALGDG